MFHNNINVLINGGRKLLAQQKPPSTFRDFGTLVPEMSAPQQQRFESILFIYLLFIYLHEYSAVQRPLLKQERAKLGKNPHTIKDRRQRKKT
jgi:hypothetical protein